jgi:hypothetical protein
VELEQELGCHAFSIYHQGIQMPQLDRLFIAVQQLRDALPQMLITSMRGGKPRMALIVMQHH